MLSALDLTRQLGKKEYEERMQAAQLHLLQWQRTLYDRRLPVVIGFEGWDASGKGGAIRRLVSPLDPRGYKVYPVGPPTPEEQSRPYLWRFGSRWARAGEMVVFDRTWYGRVLVERVEELATPEAWQRAYREINDFERIQTDNGSLILKFWIHISKEEQLRRFHERQADPFKQWKLTEQDWHNRKRWDAYLEAAEQMLERTHTTWAPWHLIEGEDKHFARVKIVETVVRAIEERLKT